MCGQGGANKMNDDKKDIQYLNFMINSIHADKRAYMAYKRCEKCDSMISEEELELIEILDELGFPLDQVGTYLYKELILAILRNLKGIPIRFKVLNEEELIEELNNPFSQFYFDIARNDLDIGIKTFHAAITLAIEKVRLDDYNSRRKELLGDNFDLNNYSLNALSIAKYYFDLKCYRRRSSKLNRVRSVDKKIISVDFSSKE